MTDTQSNDEHPLPEEFQPLHDRLRTLGDEERDAIRRRTDETIETIKNDANSQKITAMKEGQVELEGLAESIGLKAVSQANRTRRDRVRREIGIAVNRVMGSCKERASALLDDPSFAPHLSQFLQEAMCCAQTYRARVGGGEFTVVVHPKLADSVRRLLDERGQTATITESDSAGAGVTVLLQDTPYRIINTVESRLLKNEETVRSLISKRLTEALEEAHVE